MSKPVRALVDEGILRSAELAEVVPPDDPRRVAASIAMFERLAEHWSLRGSERQALLGGVSKSTWSEWRQRPSGARLKADTRERIANLFAIDLNLHSLFAPEFADRWVRSASAAFAGESPLVTMLRGRVEDVITVRRYLERVRTSSPDDREHLGTPIDTADVAVSYLAREAEANDALAASLRRGVAYLEVLASLRRGVAYLEVLSSKEPMKYRPVLASAASALASWLQAAPDDGYAVDRLVATTNEAEALLRKALEIRRQLAAEDDRYTVDQLDALVHLERLLIKLGKTDEAAAASLEADKLLEECALRNRDTA